MSSSGGADDTPPPLPPGGDRGSRVRAKKTRVRRRVRIVYHPTFVPLPTTGDNPDVVNDDSEPVGEPYLEGTYNYDLEDIVDQHNRYVIIPDGKG